MCVELYFEIWKDEDEIKDLKEYNLEAKITSDGTTKGVFVTFIGKRKDLFNYMVEIIGYDDFAANDMLDKFGKTYLKSDKLKDFNKTGVFESQQFYYLIQLNWTAEDVKFFKSKEFKSKLKMYNLKCEVVNVEGPSGWPIIELTSTKKSDILDFLKYEYDEDKPEEFFQQYGDIIIKSKKLKNFNDKTGLLD